MLNPCCCITPRIGTFIFGVIDLISGISWLLLCIRDILDTGTRTGFALWIETGLAALLIFGALLLILGAYRNAADKIRLWLVMWTIYCVVVLVVIILNLWETSARINPRGGSSMGFILLFIYEIWVVYAYLHELKFGPSGLTYCPGQVI